jgi:hypothetical protein
MGHGFESAERNIFSPSMSDICMNSDVDIGTLPISKWRFSVPHICLRYWHNRCRWRISPPTLRSMSMPTYAHLYNHCIKTTAGHFCPTTFVQSLHQNYCRSFLSNRSLPLPAIRIHYLCKFLKLYLIYLFIYLFFFWGGGNMLCYSSGSFF